MSVSDSTCRLEVRLDREDFMDQIGREQRFLLKIRNCSEQEVSGVFCFQPPLTAEPCRKKGIWLDSLASGQALEIPLTYTFNHGGRHQFCGWIEGQQVSTLWKDTVFLSGAGFYSGDTHTHSCYSDGMGTLAENRDSMLEKGHSFLYSTDHDTMEHQEGILDFHKQDESKSFLHIAGWEFTSQYGHALAYGTASPADPKRISQHGDLAGWQDFVHEMKNRNGIVFFAHPYEAPEFEFGDTVVYNIRGITGIEVWNGYNYHAINNPNRQAFHLWDKLNMAGKGHYIGNAVSDAHTAPKQGTPFIKGYLAELSTQAVHHMLKRGGFFGSNGPEIVFFMNGQGMGDTCKLTQGKMVHAQLRVFDPLGRLERITLLRGKIHGEKMQEVLHATPQGETEGTLWEKDWHFDVAPGEFYRVEVLSEMGTASYNRDLKKQEKGFAFSNPIWVEDECSNPLGTHWGHD
ncbi:MAG: CehA/McbA family metallohydrolase [Peptococcaceae bacterium]|nr:CehA/McbA family metallohydrolase [Peptococcaceae bacterium]